MSKRQNDIGTAWAAWLVEARRLRSFAVESEADYLRFLQSAEAGEVWRACGRATFAEVLSGENLVRHSRYEAFKSAVSRFGWEHVRSVGFEPARIALAIPPDAKSRAPGREELRASDAVIADMESFRVRNGTPPSNARAKLFRDEHYAMPKVERGASPAERIRELERENARLWAENARLKARIATAGVRPAKVARRKAA